MQLTIDFVALLRATVAPTMVSHLVSQGTNLPAVVYSQRGGQRDLFYRGSYGLRETDFTVDLYASTYSEVVALRDNLTDTFHGFTGLMGTTMVGRASISNILESFEDKGGPIFRIIVDIKVLD